MPDCPNNGLTGATCGLRIFVCLFIFGTATATTPERLFAAFTPNLGHVLAVLADGFATFATRFARFVCVEFVRGAFGVGSAPTFTGDFTLFGLIHRGKPAHGTTIRASFLIFNCVTCLSVSHLIHSFCVRLPSVVLCCFV